MRVFASIAVIITGALLLFAVDELPRLGDPDSPPNESAISQHYIKEIYNETHVPNLVTAVLADYRSYDTMFETVVVLTAGIAIIAILRGLGPQTQRQDVPAPDDLIIETTCRLLTPVIQLFALYVLAHGHYSPGGGFQGGVIFGASFILLALSRDLNTALQRLNPRNYLILAILGVVVFAGHGWVAQMLGGNFMDYSALWPPAPKYARYWSMLGVEIGVFLTVSTIMFAIYANLATRGALAKGL